MPYLRTKTFLNKDGSKREYLYLVEAIRTESGKVRQKTIGVVGRLDELRQSGSLERLTEAFSKFVSGTVSLEALKVSPTFLWSKRFGAVYVLRQLWKRWNYERLLDLGDAKYSEALFCMVANRLLDPRSKLGLEEWKKNYDVPAWETLQVQHCYRAMDALLEKKAELEKQLAQNVITLFSQDVSMVMFDTTSVQHWGEGEFADILKHGYSKDKRGDLPQVIVGVLMTKEGIPFAHEVWEGNQADAKSFRHVIETAKAKYALKEVIWVADRGMVNRKNIELLEDLKMKYIFGVRMRRALSAEQRKALLGSPKGFRKVSEKLRVKDVRLDGVRYIVCHNPVQARLDEAKRKRFRALLERKVSQDSLKTFMVKNGYRKYLNLKGELTIDWKRFDDEPLYDGKWVLCTNTDLSNASIGKAYKSLAKIEQVFRTLKSPLAVDPMFHWTEKRIRSHIFVCFLALQLHILLKIQLKGNLAKPSVKTALEELDRIHSVCQKLGPSDSVAHLTEFSSQAKSIFESLKIPKPATLQNRFLAQPNKKL